MSALPLSRQADDTRGTVTPVAQRKIVAVRLSQETLARIDRYVAQIKATTPGLDVTPSDAIRILIDRGLEAVEAERPTKPRKR